MNVPQPGAQTPDEGPAVAGSSSRGRWLIHLLVIGSYPIVLGLLGWNRSAGGPPALTRSAQGLLLTCAVQLAIFAFIFLLGWLASRASRDQLLLRWRPGFWAVPLGMAYSVALRFALGIIAMMVFAALLLAGVVSAQQAQEYINANRPDVGAMVDITALRTNPLYFWLTLTLVSFVVAGLREELWRSAVLAAFTALWPGRFSSRIGQLGAVAIVALAFGSGHISMGPVAVVAAALLGLGLGAVMVFHRSIWPAVIAHGMFDATTFALLPWVMEKMPKG